MNDVELPHWPRPHYEAGGGEPFVFYAVYGRIDTATPLSRETYRSNGIPDGIDLMAYGPDAAAPIPDDFRSGQLWDNLQIESDALASRVQACDACLILRGSPTDDTSLDYLRDAIGLVAHFLDHGGVAVYDPQMLKLWSPEAWRDKLFDPGRASPVRHAVILASDERQEADDASTWYHTRGMRVFGRPDLSARGIGALDESSVIELFNRLIAYQALGHVVPDGQEIRMEHVPEGTTAHHAGHLEDPDFNNIHLDIRWKPRNDAGYTAEEVRAAHDGTPIERGDWCPRCRAYTPRFADLTDRDLRELRALHRTSKAQAMRELERRTGCPLHWAKTWALHAHGPEEAGPPCPCPHCGEPLRTPKAKQCLHCGADWH